ncbi:MAG TPA: MFS transporter [Pseudogracilibacillus sp.]|nr:MFS transporter [Pseudogracilibacillus sp.]
MWNKVFSYLQQKHTQKDLILLLIIGGLYALGIFLSNTFVNVYLWRQTNDYLTIAFYNFAIFIVQPLTYLVVGKVVKMIDRIFVLRTGVIFLTIFFITVLMIGENAAKYNVLLGCLLGIGYGCYGLAFNLLAFEITEPETRDFFNGYMGALESLGGMIGPFIAGFIIAKMKTEIGYMTVFSISLGLFLLAVFMSFFIQKRKANGRYCLHIAWSEVKRNANVRNMMLANMFQGMREGLFVFVVAIWVYLVTKSELALGTFTLVLNGCSLIFFFLITKFVKPQYRKTSILIGSIFISLSVFIILFQLTYTQLLVYAIVVGVFSPLLHVPFDSMAYDVIGKSHKAKTYRIEYIVWLEVFVNIGRIISVTAFIIGLYTFPNNIAIPFVMATFSIAYFFVYLFVKKTSFI